MSSRFDDLRPCDQMDLGDVWKDDVMPGLRTDCASRVEEFFSEREDVSWGKKKRAEIADEVASVIIAWLKPSGMHVSCVPPILADFVDSIGRRGWEIFDPAQARQLRNALTKRQERATTRRPRVKRLKEDA